MLHHPQRGIHRLAGARFDCMAYMAIQLVYSTVRFHTHMVFGHAVSSDQPGGSIVTMPRVDLHGNIEGTLRRERGRRSRTACRAPCNHQGR